jgi:hypothetical protein
MSDSPFKLLLLVLLLSIFEIGLAVAVFFMPDSTIDIGGLVQTQLSDANLTYPLTALLINFRGYDTLLCLTILLFALVGIWIVYPLENQERNSSSPPFEKEKEAQLPYWILWLLVLTVGYILWGAYQSPFQAGAVLAGIGLLFLFKNKIPPSFSFSKEGMPSSVMVRLLVSIGLLVFMSLALAIVIIEGQNLLSYPKQWANSLILVIEISLIVTIGVIFLKLSLEK